MVAVKGIPYGVSRFDEVRRSDLYYVDKTQYLPLLEDTGNYLFLIRPRRFGKSLFVSMMECYYDVSQADSFDDLFGGLWIHQHPTKLKNAYQVIYFDFSKANLGMGDLQENFNAYLCSVLKEFIVKYRSFYPDMVYDKVMQSDDSGVILGVIDAKARTARYPLYLIIDEYDNFTNVILSEQGTDVFKSLTHASGFYREYFKTFKAMFSRVFLIGVSPVTLDDLTSGYNIDWGIARDPRFNAMLGFSESDVRTMLHYYQATGRLRDSADVNTMIEEMKPWYDNYCFAEECLAQERVFNCDMVLYYLRNQVLYGRSPKDMVDKNIRTGYAKLKMLANIDKGRQWRERMGVIEEISATGQVLMMLKDSFPAEDLVKEDNFRSLLYYYGMLTMGGTFGQRIRMVIPNHCVREQYWSFLRSYYERKINMDVTILQDEMDRMTFDGDWRCFIEHIAKAYREASSVRDAICGEHNIQGFFKAYFALNTMYMVEPEIELNYGYGDFLLLPDKARYPEVAHSYIMEFKYVKPAATDEELYRKSKEADGQLAKYARDRKLIHLCQQTQLHLLKVVFRGTEMVVCCEIPLNNH